MSASPSDPWAHRRGEPRGLAFAWSLYLIVCVGGSLAWLASTGQFTRSGYSPAARIMLVVIAAGATMLWPMTRLSQALPRTHLLASIVADMVVLLLPVEAVIMPASIIAGWPTPIAFTLAFVFIAWTVLVGSMLALAYTARSTQTTLHPGRNRSAWMVAIVVMLTAGPAATGILLSRGLVVPHWLPMLSPFTAIFALSGHGLSGPSGPVDRVQYIALACVAAAGVFLWGVAGSRQASAR